MNKIDIDENELAALISTNDEEIKDLIYEKYNYIIDVIIKKYSRFIKMFQVDEQDIRAEALYGFSDGIRCFNDNKKASFKTFLTLCVERRVHNILTKYTSVKSKTINEALSLDSAEDNDDVPLLNFISDECKFEPLNNLVSLEFINDILRCAKKSLSSFEYEVFTYIVNETSYVDIAKKLEKTPKQIDNTIQRIKIKMRDAINDLRNNR